MENATSFLDFTDKRTLPQACWSSHDVKTRLQYTKCPFNIFPCPFLMSGKQSVNLYLRQQYSLHEYNPFRIYSICNVVPSIILHSIDGELYPWSLSFQLSDEQRWLVKHVNIIVWANHTEISMPYTKVVRSNRFKDHSRNAVITAGKLSSPCMKAFLPWPMHTVDAP